MYIAINPENGLHLREATEQEIATYLKINATARKSFEKMVRVGDVLIDFYTGPGAWFGGAGF
jgi:hypothetical protein